jgi:hypothetical protein
MAYNTDIERMNYYEGEYLGAKDFQAEQEYHRDMRRRHNLGQHTWGIVTGLELAQAPNGGQAGSNVEVDVYLQPGMAVDGFGREIVLLTQTQLTQQMFAAFYNPDSNAKPQWMYIWIAYQQALLKPPSDACTSMNVSKAFGRVEETYALTATATASAPPNSAIVVDGTQTTPPVEPSPPATSTAPLTDPPSIPLPYDDSVPFQEFSTEDLVWWLPLGRVMWDPHNEVFIQTNADPTQAAIAAAVGREYAGNVSATTYAPTGNYTILDREAPYPLPAKATDPSYNGVQVEIVGALQVDRLLNAETNVLIGGDYNPSSKVPLSPLTIIASGLNEELIQFRNPAGQETWHICENLNGTSPGINFGEFTSPGTAAEGRLFLQAGGRVGIGTLAPQQNLSVNAAINLDQAGANSGNLNPGLTFGNKSGEGISSNRAAGGVNANGLDFYIASAVRMSLTQAGRLGLGTAAPAAQLEISGGQWDLTNTAGDLRIGNNAMSLKFGVALGGAGAGDGRIRAVGGTNRLMIGAGTSDTITVANSRVGINTLTPQQDLSVDGSLNVDQADQNTGAGVHPGITFGSTSGEGIASQRTGANRFGLNFYTGFTLKMSIASPANGGGVATTGNLTIGAAPVSQNLPAPGTLTINGNRTYLLGADAANWHWIMAGGKAEFDGTGGNNALGFSYDSATRKGFITTNSNWTMNFAGPKIGFVVDRFINRSGEQLERGDVVVIHEHSAGPLLGGSNQIPLIEVERTSKACDPRVCGVVDEPVTHSAGLQDLDPKKLGKRSIGLMVTLGAYGQCKVDADIAPILAGDLLTTSPTPGHAQRLADTPRARPGVVIGKALKTLEKGKGLIPALISHQ